MKRYTAFYDAGYGVIGYQRLSGWWKDEESALFHARAIVRQEVLGVISVVS